MTPPEKRDKSSKGKGKRVGYCLALLILRVFLANELALLRRGSASSVGIHDCDCAAMRDNDTASSLESTLYS